MPTNREDSLKNQGMLLGEISAQRKKDKYPNISDQPNQNKANSVKLLERP